MIDIGLAMTRAGGWPRMLLVGACTAVVSGLLLVIAAILRLPAEPAEPLFALVAEPGLRGGTVFGTAMLCVPAVLLLYQAVRLGTAARERRLAALRLAGATPGDVRVLGAIEVAIPAFAGSVAGVGVYGGLRITLGDSVATSFRLVPTTVRPAWWHVALVVVAVTALGLVVGLLASRRAVVTPLGLTRRASSGPPRPWGLLLLLAAGAVLTTALKLPSRVTPVAIFAVVALAVLGIVSLASWITYGVARYVLARTASPTLTLAASRVVAEPRAVGRAAAAVGGIALVAGGGGMSAAPILGETGDPFYAVSYGLVALLLLVALLMVVGTLAVHSVESLLDRKRSIAALAALGTSIDEMERAQFAEISLAAMPVAAAGALLGTVAVGGVGVATPIYILVQLPIVAATLGLVWTATAVAVRATRPWVRRAIAVENLRTA
jgi:hypothetical protein